MDCYYDSWRITIHLLVATRLAVLSLVAVATMVTFIVVIPLAGLLSHAESLPWAMLQERYYQRVLAWTIGQALASAAAAGLIGVALGWVLARFHFFGQQIIERSLLLPFVMPTLVAAQGILLIWHEQHPLLLIFGNVFFNAGFVAITCQKAFSSLPKPLLAAATLLGFSNTRRFFILELRLIAAQLSTCLVLVVAFCSSNFSLAIMLSGFRHATIEVEIYSLLAHQLKISAATVLALTLLTLGGILIAIYAWLHSHIRHQHTPQPLATKPLTTWQQRSGISVIISVFCCVCITPILLALLSPIIDWSWSSSWQLFSSAQHRAAWINTLTFTLITAVGASVLAWLHAICTLRWRWMRGVFLLPWLISPVLLGVGILHAYPGVAGSMTVLLAAYIFIAYPLLGLQLTSALERISVSYIEAAQTLGASNLRVWLRIIIPLMLPVWRQGLTIAGATAIGEFAITLFLSRPKWLALTTLLYQKISRAGAINHFHAQLIAIELLCLVVAWYALVRGRQPVVWYA